MEVIRRSQLKSFGAYSSKRSNIIKNEIEGTNLTVFLSHAHEDKSSGILEDVEKFLGFFDASIYVDWADKGMIDMEWKDRVLRLREKMDVKKRFVLLATEAALKSRWVSWELGYADGSKGFGLRDFIAILPIADEEGSFDDGNEFTKVYSRIMCLNPKKDWREFESNDEDNWVVRSPFEGVNDRTLKHWLDPPLFG